MNRYVTKIADRFTKVFLPRLHTRLRERQLSEFRLQAAVWNNDILRIIEKVIADSGVYVRGGPFKGMMYWPVGAPGYWAGGLTSSLLGVYERELHASLAELVRQDYEQVINVGCAEGYYAVGLALRLPAARVFAFDTDGKARRLCQAMALVNGVSDRVVVEGECTVERIRDLTTKRSLIICDCEGCEVHLLRPDLAPGLAGCDILVELHDIFQPGITEKLLPRFAPTHEIKLLTTEPRDPAELQHLEYLSIEECRKALDERRPGSMQWAVMRSLARAHQ